MTIIFINGKFTAQTTTGVQRSAACTVVALDLLLTNTPLPGVQWVLLCPRGAALPVLAQIAVRAVGRDGLALHAWEQLVLPWVARGALLLNLAGSAPFWKRRQVCTLHDAAVFDCPQAHTWAFRAWYRALFRRVARVTPRVLTVSEFSKRRLMDCLGVAEERVGVLPGSGEHMRAVRANEQVLSRLGLQDGRFFVAVGSANPTKNHPALIAAFEALPAGFDARLVLVGGSNDAVFKAEGRVAGADRVLRSDRILRTGRLSDAELKALYGAALGLLFPSLYEGFGLPLLEAMTCGCPVAASTAASIPEVCGDAALYFDPKSITEIAAAIVKLADDPALRERLRSLGTQRAQAFSWAGAARVLWTQAQAQSLA